MDEYRNFLKDRTNSKSVNIIGTGKGFNDKDFIEDKFKIKDREIKIYIKKV